MNNSFYGIYSFIKRHRLPAMFLALLGVALSIWAISHIQFNDDISRIIPTNDKSSTSTEIISSLSFSDKIVVIISKKNRESDLAEVANSFLDSIASYHEYYYNIQGALDEESFKKYFHFIYEHLPIYLDSTDYALIERKLNLDSISSQVYDNYETLTNGGSMSFMKEIIIKDPLKLSFMALQKMQHLQGPSDYVLDNGYLYSKNRDKLFLFINPKNSGVETKKTKYL